MAHTREALPTRHDHLLVRPFPAFFSETELQIAMRLASIINELDPIGAFLLGGATCVLANKDAYENAKLAGFAGAQVGKCDVVLMFTVGSHPPPLVVHAKTSMSTVWQTV